MQEEFIEHVEAVRGAGFDTSTDFLLALKAQLKAFMAEVSRAAWLWERRGCWRGLREERGMGVARGERREA